MLLILLIKPHLQLIYINYTSVPQLDSFLPVYNSMDAISLKYIYAFIQNITN